MATVNTSTVIFSANLVNEYLNHPAVPGLSQGYWILAKPGSTTDKNDDAFLVYKWGTEQLIAPPQANLAIDGSFEILEETWDGATRSYHNSTITHIGPGVNDVTGAEENDALFFAHLGTLRSAQDDNPFYWDRAFQLVSGGNWDYYQYHQHNPNVYEDDFSNGRIVFTDGKFIDPTDPHYGYLIYAESTVSKVEYQSVLARIHQPSVGGAHSSHLDVELPSTAAANYIIGGIHKGSSNRYHAFYITADAAQWKVLSRTFVLSSRTFTAEVNLGTFDLADPVFVSNSNIAEYPLRASCGELIGDDLYIPVIYNNATSGYDLKIWKITSADSLSSASLTVSTILTGASFKPDCHLILHPIENVLYAVVGEGDGAAMYSWDGFTWTDEGQFLTNGSGSTDPLRIHGVSYNSSERRFYVMVSGVNNASGTYDGQGLYSFQLTFTAREYQHFDFDVGNNAFILRNAGVAGHIRYEHPTGSWRRYTTAEPDPIPESNSVFKYDYTSPQFFKRKSTAFLGGGEYFYDVTALEDGRMVFCGRIEDNEGNRGFDDFLVAIYDGDEEGSTANYYCDGGEGPDYFTGMAQKANSNYIYLTGYTKSLLVDLKEQRLHPYVRRTLIENANTTYNDLAITSNGLVVTVGTTQSNNGVLVVKHDANLNVAWTKIINSANLDYGYTIDVDSDDNIYVGGQTTTNTAGQGGIIVRLLSNGDISYIRTIDAAADQDLKTIKVSTLGNVFLGVSNTTNTQIVKMQADGTIYWQKDVPDFSVKNLVVDTSENIYAAGYHNNGSENRGKVLKMNTNGSLNWIRYVSNTIFYGVAYDNVASNVIVVGANSTPNAIMVKYNSSGTQQWAQIVNVNSQFTSVVIDNENNIYGVGYENQISRVEHHAMSETRDRSFIMKFNQAGAMGWKNYYRNKDPSDNVYDSQLLACKMDHLNEHIYMSGKAVFANEENGLLTRACRNGYGTGILHKDDDVLDYFIYEVYPQSNVVSSVTSSSETPTLTNSGLSLATPSHTYTSATVVDQNIFDGSSGLWNFVLAKFDLDKAQTHKNEDIVAKERPGIPMYNSNAFTKFYVIGTAGDSIADDGNIFGYDVLQYSDNVFYFACQTSGDVNKTNLGDSGVYDGLIIRFDETKPAGREFTYYQDGTEFDEEYYAITKLADGNVAMTGRTAGTIGGASEGGYDIIVSILDVNAGTWKHKQFGGPGDDKGVNLHDIGNNQIAIVYQTTDNIANTSTVTSGGDDIGILIYNYSSNTLANAFQTGSQASELLDTNGRVSALLPGNTVAIVGATAGTIATVGDSVGSSDIFVALCDLNTGNITKYQTGTTGADLATCCILDGDKLLIGGFTDSSWTDPEDGIVIHFDPNKGLKATTSVN